MAIPTSGALSFSTIGNEMGISGANTLSYLSSYAGNTTGFLPSGLTSAPYAMGEFRGFNFENVTFSQVYNFFSDPCGSQLSLYLGSNGLYYNSPGGSVASGYYGYTYSYFDSWNWTYVWNTYFFSSGSAINWGTTNSGCAGLGGPTEF